MTVVVASFFGGSNRQSSEAEVQGHCWRPWSCRVQGVAWGHGHPVV